LDYKLKVAQQNIHLGVNIQEDKTLKISDGKENFRVAYHMIDDGMIHMAVTRNSGTTQANAYIAGTAEGKIVFINGRQYLICDLEAQGRTRKKEKTSNLPDQITPPMPAVVVRIPVQVGDRVQKGQAVIVVSAMKMETTLCAPFNGTVARINAALNDKVMPGQTLVEIEKEKIGG